MHTINDLTCIMYFIFFIFWSFSYYNSHAQQKNNTTHTHNKNETAHLREFKCVSNYTNYLL